jgi:dTDP-4-amino-4,6-dideoxygalactose transaminase
MQTNIPVFKPLLQQEEMAAATGALELGWLGMGAYVGQFEAALKAVLGAEDRHVVAVSTGHAALHLALLVAGPHDRVAPGGLPPLQLAPGPRPRCARAADRLQ